MLGIRMSSIKRAALLAATTVTALGAFVGGAAPTASAATRSVSTTTVCSSGTLVYGVPFNCTVTVTDISIGTKVTPKGTVTVDTILNRLLGGSCVLNPSGTGASNSCTVSVTALDTGVLAPKASSYSSTSSHSIWCPLGVCATVPGLANVGSAPLTITAQAASRTYGAANPSFTVGYSGFVNGDDEYDLLGSLSCSTTATSTSDASTYPITCSGLTSPNSILNLPPAHYSITWAPGTLTVEKADLTVTAEAKSRGYAEANPTLTASYATFATGDDESDLDDPVVCSTTADSSSPVGDYPITCSAGADNNYDLHFTAGNLHVGTADLVITADDKSRVVGAANPTFTVKYATFQGTDDEGVLGGALECTTTADSNSPVGDYPITCSGLTSDNYSIDFVAGTLHVLAAPGGSLPGGSGSYQAGGAVEVDVHDFKPGSTVIVNGCGIVDGEIVIDANGNGHATFPIPADMDTSKCELTLTGTDNADAPAEIEMTMEVLGLVRTGSSSLSLGLTAGLALVLGFGLVLLGRRRYAWR